MPKISFQRYIMFLHRWIQKTPIFLLIFLLCFATGTIALSETGHSVDVTVDPITILHWTVPALLTVFAGYFLSYALWRVWFSHAVSQKGLTAKDCGHLLEGLSSGFWYMNKTDFIQLKQETIQSLYMVNAADKPLSAPHYLQFMHKTLLRVHMRNNQDDLLMAVLFALERIGTADSVPYIRTLTCRLGKDAGFPPLQAAAQSCLESIEARLRQQNLPETLLRPSSSILEADVLLRSASGTEQATPEETAQLLRPIVGQDDAPNV